MNNNKVMEIHVIGEGSTVFTDSQYCIPLYQRDFAWEEKQIVQLIEDINDVTLGTSYYIGSLIVAMHDDMYEVVDGQQRLTTLFLLLSFLGQVLENDHELIFECRDRSNYTLSHIHVVMSDERDKFDVDRLQTNIISGLRIIENYFRNKNIDKEDFVERLKNVVLYRIEVPDHTDLNHYFEIMNTRGEQLEQSDVLKAKLMNCLDGNEQMVFAAIWDACRDMTGYAQMHFTPEVRKEIYSGNWGELPSKDIKDYKSLPLEKSVGSEVGMMDIIKPDFQLPKEESVNEDGVRIRFESIIDFPYFLLHTLKVFLELNPKIVPTDKSVKLMDELMDDKKLTSAFERVLDEGRIDGNKLCEKTFSKKFILCLLRTRYLFDNYIIKREYVTDTSDGEWSLKSLFVSGQGRSKRGYYANTKFAKYKQWASTSTCYHMENLMLQSSMRVSYTSPKVMHWITQLLIWLSKNADDLYYKISDEFHNEINRVALKPVREFLDSKNYKQGVNTHHMVLNYLDYLLWREDKNVDFTFEFRNSVEHWYPQHPSEGTFDKWEDDVDSFGNLCLIQRNINSKFSNMSPEAKKSTFKEMIGKGSLKLREMSKLTQGPNASQKWKDKVYKEHEVEMISRLQSAIHSFESEEVSHGDGSPTHPQYN